MTVGTDGASGGATAGTSTTGASTAGTGGGTDCPNQQVWCSNGQGSGTCVNLQIDPENCGECGNACDPGESCLGGECKGG
ncbi:MAG: hypothetical protein D6705_18800 [Deltaproteobacteria bacterium]|nr:MAG: hypothetical protein D6705_18800 [Deltaproteobacteria bacterium]